MSNTSYPFQENKNNVMHAQGGEKKVMKKILSVALSTAMAFSMFASVAFGDTAKLSTQEKFDALKVKGIFAGDTDGLAHLERDMTRAEFAKVITKVMGLKEVTGTYSYNDAGYNNPKNWAAPFIEAVSAAGVMQGKDLTKKLFDQKANVTVQELAEVLVKAMKLEIPTKIDNSASEWAKGSVQAAINAGLLSKDLNFQANANRSLLVEAAFTAEATLNPVVPVVTTATKVEKVTATNLKEIDVAFDGTVDKSTAEDKERYSVDSSVTIDSASLQADGKSVRLTTTGNLQNQKQYKISVRNVKAGDKTVSVTNYEFTPLDNALPEVVTVKSLGTKAVKVTFSEPVKSASSANFKLDGKSFFGNVSQGKRDVILKPYTSTDLSVGAHKVEVSGVEDYNGFKALSKSFDFEVVSDTVAPTIANVTATLEKATVTFSEEVDPETVLKGNVYWKSGSDKKTADSVKEISPEVYEFTFKSSPFPGYETPFFVEGVKDYSGNQITATETKLRAEVDQTRPEVTEVTLKSNNNKIINVKFSKEVKVEDVKYFTLTKSNGDVVALRNVKGVNGSTEDKAFELETYDALSDNSYTLKIVGVRDTTKLNNTMLDYSQTVGGKDTDAPKVTSNSGNTSTRTLYINFNKKLDPTTVGDKSNYLVTINGKPQQLPSGTEVSPTNEGKAVRIVFPQYIDNDRVGINEPGSTANITHFNVLALKDLSGNVITNIGKDTFVINTEAAKVAEYEAGKDYQAKLTGQGVIKVRFDQPISTVRASDFTTTKGSVTSATADGTDLVTVNISGLSKTGLTYSNDSTELSLAIVANSSIRTVTGNTASASEVEILDGLSPQVQLASGESRLNVENFNTILLPFSETLKVPANQAEYRYDLIVTNIKSGTPLTFNEYTTTVVGNVLKITLGTNTKGDYKVSVKKDASFIQDNAGNTADSSSEYATRAGAIDTDAAGEADAAAKVTAATNAVAKAQSTKSPIDFTSAEGLVKALPNGTVKSNLEDKLTALKVEIDAATALTTAKADAKIVIDAARALAAKAKVGTEAGQYVDAVDILTYRDAIETAQTAVSNATTKVQADDAVKTLNKATETFKAAAVVV
ncbi:hypothetical protein PMSD_08880 [Paenibacillus macquariensis subsp. defensor]|nr:hypothetical protein PMSD_08880 [Paenibacillus macquariensis subsp. defensor]